MTSLFNMENIDVKGKICGACLHTLTSEYFSKKQWKQKQRRRCKRCGDIGKEIDVDGLSAALQSIDIEKTTEIFQFQEVRSNEDSPTPPCIGSPLRFKVSR